ncbi:hypothetical protein [Mycobacterium simulans]|uniref:hypothetical protein n=1 Tax=Mycobacterium simulans TaxID=627089 RepID=UPI0021E527CA|nr:hypothetical protein [Mycobacterium simulans]
MALLGKHLTERAAPWGSGMGAGAPAGGAGKPGLVSATEPADEDDREDGGELQPGERLT